MTDKPLLHRWKRVLYALDGWWCYVHNTYWAIRSQYVMYRKHAVRDWGRWEAARQTWRDREYWDR